MSAESCVCVCMCDTFLKDRFSCFGLKSNFQNRYYITCNLAEKREKERQNAQQRNAAASLAQPARLAQSLTVVL